VVMRKILVASLAVLLYAITSSYGQKITAYGYANDATPDTNSSNYIGNHNNTMVPYGSGGFTSAALTAAAANQYGVGLNQNFTVTAANGQTYQLNYADTVPTGGANQQPAGSSVIDIFDPNSQLTGGGNDNSFSSAATSVNGAAVTGAAAPGLGATRDVVEDISIPVVNPMLQKFQAAAQAWAGPLTRGATTIFWILALIALVWNGGSLLLQRVDLVEILAVLFRFVFVTGFFFWLLTNSATFATAIIGSLRILGGQASGTGQAIFPMQIVNLGVSVLQAQMKPINWLMPIASVIPILLSIVVLITTVLIAANMVVLIVAAWIVAYAGVIVLGFGGGPWFRDIAINYFRTALGVGLSLMVMELIIGLATSFLQALVQQSEAGDIGQLVAITIAVILIAMLSHRLPTMVSGMVTGSGHHNGAIGAFGLMGAIGAAMATAGLARGMAGGVGGVAANGAMSSAKLLQDRILAGEAAMASGLNGSDGSSGNQSSPMSASPSSGLNAGAPPTGRSPNILPVTPAATGKPAPASSKPAPPASQTSIPKVPSSSAPMSPDDQWLADNPDRNSL
jgi:type IV secretion system protein TrbL